MVSRHGWTLTPYLPTDTTVASDGSVVPVTPSPSCGDYNIQARCVQLYTSDFQDCLLKGENPSAKYPPNPMRDPNGVLYTEANTISGFQQVIGKHYGKSGVGDKNSWIDIYARYISESEDLTRNRLNVLWSSLSRDEQETTRCIEIKHMNKTPLNTGCNGQYKVAFDRPCSPIYQLETKGECVTRQKNKCVDCCIRSRGNLTQGDWCANAAASSSGSGVGSLSGINVSNFVAGNRIISELLASVKVSLPYDIVNSVEIENFVYDISYLSIRYDIVTKSLNNSGSGSGSGSGSSTDGNGSALAIECQNTCNRIFNDYLGEQPGYNGITTRKLNETLVKVIDGLGGFGSPGYQKHYNDCHRKYSQYVSDCVSSHKTLPIGGAIGGGRGSSTVPGSRYPTDRRSDRP